MAKRKMSKKGQKRVTALIGILIVLAILDKEPGILVVALGLAVLVAAGLIAWKVHKAQRLRKSGIQDIDKMDGHRFERYLGVLFKALGYKSAVTRASGDYGADLVIEKDGTRIVVQAKRYSGNVGIKAVQEVHAAIPYYHADEGWVVANQDFTDAAKRLARTNGIRLIGRDELIRMSLRVKDLRMVEESTAAMRQQGEP